jgi:hypothetical protein
MIRRRCGRRCAHVCRRLRERCGGTHAVDQHAQRSSACLSRLPPGVRVPQAGGDRAKGEATGHVMRTRRGSASHGHVEFSGLDAEFFGLESAAGVCNQQRKRPPSTRMWNQTNETPDLSTRALVLALARTWRSAVTVPEEKVEKRDRFSLTETYIAVEDNMCCM